MWILRHIAPLFPVSILIRLKKQIHLLYDQAGYGDTLLVAAVAREIKKKYKKVTVIVHRTKDELLKHNPYVDGVSQSYRGINLNYHYMKNKPANIFSSPLLVSMCKKVGIRNPSQSVNIFLTRDERLYASSVLNSLKRPIITIQTTSNSFDSGRKQWPLDHWTELVALCNKNHMSVVQLGGDKEPKISGVFYRCGMQTIRQSIAVIEQADLHIGIVSSLMHGAAAVSKPAIILFGGFERYALHCYPLLHPIESTIDCSPCFKPNTIVTNCTRNRECMTSITPFLVFSKAKKILSNQRIRKE